MPPSGGQYQFTYQVIYDTSKALAAVRQFRQEWEAAFGGNAGLQQAAQQQQQAVNQLTAQQRTITSVTRAEAQARLATARSEATVRTETARQLTAVVREQERRTTMELRAELRQREQAVRQSAQQQQQAMRSTATGGGLMGAYGAVGGALATVGVGLGVREIAQFAAGMVDLDTQVRRSNLAFKEFSGGAGQAARNLEAVQRASGGTLTTLEAQRVATQALSLGLAQNATDLERVTRVARGVTLVSPVIHDMQSAFAELGLAAANQSWRRLDQLGLSVSEVRARFDELQASNANLTKEQAFLQAMLDAGEAKFGALTSATEAQASGTERLRVAWVELRTEMSQSDWVDAVGQGFGILADDIIRRFGSASGQAQATIRLIKEEIASLQEEANKPWIQRDILLQGPQQDFEGNWMGSDERIQFNQDVLSDYSRQMEGLLELRSKGIDSLAAYEQALTAAQAAEANGTAGAAELVAQIEAQIEAQTKTNKATDEYIEKAAVQAGWLIDTGIATENTASTLALLQQWLFEAGIGADAFAAALAGVNAQLGAMGAAGVPELDIETQVRRARGWDSGYAANIPFSQLLGQNRPEDLLGDEAPPRALFGLEAQQEAQQRAANEYSARVKREGEERAEAQRLLEQEQKKAEREWASAAKRTQAEMERAAERMVSEFKSSLEKIPGLFSPSEVTDEDMALAEAGLYEEKADERLRQFADRVINGVVRPGTDPAEWAARVGMDPGADPKAILAKARQMWGDQSLFADPANLELINKDAVDAARNLQQQSEAGRDNIYKYFADLYGIPLEALEDAEGKIPPNVQQMLATGDVAGLTAIEAAGGVANQEAAAQVAAQAAGAMTITQVNFAAGVLESAGQTIAQGIFGGFGGEGMPDFAGTLILIIRQQIANENNLRDLITAGKGVVGMVHQGWSQGAGELDWLTPILDTAFAQAVESLAETVEGE